MSKLLSLSWWRLVFAKGGRAFGFACALVFILPIVITAGFSISMRNSNQPQQQTGAIATVNGEAITQKDLNFVKEDQKGGAPGTAHAQAYGKLIYSLVMHKIVTQLAAKLKVKASDADVDRAVAAERSNIVGPNAADKDWQTYLSERNMTADDFRDHAADSAVVKALLDHYQNAETVTLDEAKAQTAEVKMAAVFVASTSQTSRFSGAPKSLPDADAKKKADDLHAKVVGGADIIPIAKADPDPFSTSKTTGISDWQKENTENQFGSTFLLGSDVDDAIRKTPKGQLTPVIKATGFQSGYFFAKIIDRRENPPKDYDPNKVIATLKQQHGYKKLDADIKAAFKVAKVEFPKDQPAMKAYYDYAKLQEMSQEANGLMGAPAPDAPTAAQVEAQKAAVSADWEAVLKAQPDDATAELMVADDLQTKMFTAPPDEKPKIRERLIGLYESAFKSTEDTSKRFALASLYKDKQDYKGAFNQYAMVVKLMQQDQPYDLSTRQKQLTLRTQVLMGLRGLPPVAVPEATAAIDEETRAIADLNAKIREDQLKQAVERQKQDADAKAAEAKAAADKAAADKAAKEKTNAATKPAAGSAPGTAAPGTAAPTTGTAPGSSGAAGSLTLPPATGGAPATPPKR